MKRSGIVEGITGNDDKDDDVVIVVLDDDDGKGDNEIWESSWRESCRNRSDGSVGSLNVQHMHCVNENIIRIFSCLISIALEVLIK